jgi:hypothetical protein
VTCCPYASGTAISMQNVINDMTRHTAFLGTKLCIPPPRFPRQPAAERVVGARIAPNGNEVARL